jgi:hypothetical protein
MKDRSRNLRNSQALHLRSQAKGVSLPLFLQIASPPWRKDVNHIFSPFFKDLVRDPTAKKLKVSQLREEGT